MRARTLRTFFFLVVFATGLASAQGAGAKPAARPAKGPDRLGLHWRSARAHGWIKPSQRTVQRAATALDTALKTLGSRSADGDGLYAALDKNPVWGNADVSKVIKALFQGELSADDVRFASMDARLPELLRHMVAYVPSTELPFLRPNRSTKPYTSGQTVLTPAKVPPALAHEARQDERHIDMVTGVRPVDQVSRQVQRLYQDKLPPAGPKGAYTGSFVAADYLGDRQVSLPRWTDPKKDARAMAAHFPTRFAWAKGRKANSMPPDAFFGALWASTPRSRQQQIEWLMDQMMKAAPPAVLAKLPPEATRQELRRSLLLAYHHAKDIQFSMASLGYPNWMSGAHDWMEIVTVPSLRDRAIWKSDRQVIEWIDSLPLSSYPNAGIANPKGMASYWLWALGLRDGAGQGWMQVHRAVPHHTGFPPGSSESIDAPFDMIFRAPGLLGGPAEIVERGVNGVIHHMQTQGPWGVRGEKAVPRSQYRKNLKKVYEHDSAFKSTVLQAVGDDALELQLALARDGMVTPLHLLQVVDAPWKEVHAAATKREQLPWGKAVRDHLVRDVARPTWWKLPRGKRVPLLDLGANEIPWLAEYAPGSVVTQDLRPVDPARAVAALKESIDRLGGRRREVKAVGLALWVTLMELAQASPAAAAGHRASAAEVARLLGRTPESLARETVALATQKNAELGAAATRSLLPTSP